MKLLDKFESQKAKSLDKKREIDEGVKLAKKVDLLRETVSKEQANLIKFRDESLSQIKKEIEGQILKKEALILEIETLTEERNNKRIPLDAEWAKLEVKKLHIALAKDVVNQAMRSLQEKQLANLKQVKDIQAEADRIEKIKKATLDALKQAQVIKIEAETIIEQAKEYERLTIYEADKRTQESKAKKSELDYREVDLNNRENNLVARNEEIIKQTILLRDREATLEREIKRRNK